MRTSSCIRGIRPNLADAEVELRELILVHTLPAVAVDTFSATSGFLYPRVRLTSQDQVRQLCGYRRVSAVMGRRIDNRQIHSRRLGLTEQGGELAGVGCHRVEFAVAGRLSFQP
jgi:hypothetical protein